MPVSKVKPAKVYLDEDSKVGSAKISRGKKKAPASPAKGKPGKFVRKGDEDPFGSPHDYPKDMPMGPRHFVEFYERSDESLDLYHFSDAFFCMLPRQQLQCFHKLLIFNQMVGRLTSASPKFAACMDYQELLERLGEGVKEVLNVQRVRIFGVDYNSLGLARELWMVSGEPSLIGHTVQLDEWAGACATGPPNPTIAHNPTSNHKRYGMSYVDMDTRAKFDCQGLISVGVRMRDPLLQKPRTRYVLEVYNKLRSDGKKGLVPFEETDAFIAGCLARSAAAAIAWVLGNKQQQQISDFSSAVLGTASLREFDAKASGSLRKLFNCEEAVLFWHDEDHSCIWRYKTEEEVLRDARGAAKHIDKVIIMGDTVCLALEASKPVNMNETGAQFVLNVPNAKKHPKFNREVDEKYIHHRGWAAQKGSEGATHQTRCILSVPICSPFRGGKALASLQLRNKIAASGVLMDKSPVFRTDDLAFLQHFATEAASVFEYAVRQQEAHETRLQLGQARYAVTALMQISKTLCGGIDLDDLFPLVVSECIGMMSCERATLFLSKEDDKGNKMLWSKIATGVPPIAVPLKETSIAGSTVMKRVVNNIADVYNDPRFDPTFDRKNGFRTRSVLCMPIIDTMDDVCIGCLQVLNKKDRYDRSEGVVFNKTDEELAANFCSVVAIAVSFATSKSRADGSISLAYNVGSEQRGSNG